MSKDDFSVVMYKLLAYLYRCLKEGVQPNLDTAQEMCGCNDVYWQAVLADALSRDLIAGNPIRDWSGGIVRIVNVRITLDGSEYLEGNSKMAEIKAFLGKAFEVVLANAIQATSML